MKNTASRKIRWILLMGILGQPVTWGHEPKQVPGDQRKWALKFCTRLEQSGQERPLEVDLTGDWTSAIVAVRQGEYDAALQLTDVHVGRAASGKISAGALEQTERRLSRRFWATYRNDGALLAIHFFKDVDPGDRNLLQMIATEAQFVRLDASKMVWNALERDGAGSYLAVYNYADTNAVVKRKLKYMHTDAELGAPPDGLQVGVDQSELRFTFEPDGEINTLEGNDRVRIGVQFGNAEPLVAITSIRLTNLHRSKAPELIGSLDGAHSDVVSSAIVTHRPDPEKLLAQHDANLLEGHTTGSLLQAAVAKSNDDQELSQRLAALFRRRPESIPAALDLLRKNGEQKRITDALGAAHTPAAIEALSSLALGRTTQSPVRVDALTALVFVQHPRVETMRLPTSLFDDNDAQITSAARIIGGAVARAGRKEHPAEAEAIDTALIDRYRKAREVPEVCNLLAALGNSVGPSTLRVIEQALRDPRDPVRAAAARGLRLALEPEVDGLLAAAITVDSDSQVRAAAIFATSFRRPTSTLTEALIQAAKSDAAEYVRSDAISQLRAHPEASPDILTTLAWIAEHDPKPGIRRLAREGLAPTQHDSQAPQERSQVSRGGRQTPN